MASFGTGLGASPQAQARETLARQQRSRERRLSRLAKSSAARFEGARQAHENGDVWLASKLYLRVALTRPANANTAQAKAALAELAVLGRGRLTEIESQLAQGDVEAALEALQRLAEEFENVPGAGQEIALRQRKFQRSHAAELAGQQALALLQTGQSYEAAGDLCCAYLAYEAAAGLSGDHAQQAQTRLDALARDPLVVADAALCRRMREHHSAYQQALLLAESNPQRAAELLESIVEDAPPESGVYVSARQQLAELAL